MRPNPQCPGPVMWESASCGSLARCNQSCASISDSTRARHARVLGAKLSLCENARPALICEPVAIIRKPELWGLNTCIYLRGRSFLSWVVSPLLCCQATGAFGKMELNSPRRKGVKSRVASGFEGWRRVSALGGFADVLAWPSELRLCADFVDLVGVDCG